VKLGAMSLMRSDMVGSSEATRCRVGNDYSPALAVLPRTQ
jgi:hypothetical protein